jgi:Periplasmic binding protein
MGPNLNIGILASQSTLNPGAAERWIAGVQNGLSQLGNSYAVHQYVDQYNGLPSSAVERTRTMLDKTPLQALIVQIDEYASCELRRICAASNLPLVMSSLGANVSRFHSETSTIDYQTLDYWQSLTALGTWAANHLGKRAIAASSFYESGYDMPFAFRAGYQGAGGVIESSLVSHMPTSGSDLSTVMNAIHDTAPEVVCTTYCGQAAIDFVHAYVNAGFSKRIPLVASSFMVDDSLLRSLGSDAAGIYSCVSWSTEPFTLLGQRAAQRTTALLSTSGVTQRFRPVAYIPAFQTGTPSVAPDGQAFYIRQVQPASSGPQNVVMDTLSADGSDETLATSIANVNAQLQASIKTGWITEYLS